MDTRYSASVEFLDWEFYENVPTVVYEKKDDWKFGIWSNRIILISRSLVEEVTQPERLREIARLDKQDIEDLKKDIRHRGFDLPLTIVVDKSGKVVLQDGHHRFLASEGINKLPVRFQEVEYTNFSGGKEARDIFPRMLLEHSGD